MDMTPPPGLRPTVDSDGDSHCDGDVRASLSLALRRIDLLARNEHLCRAGSFELLWPDTVLWQSAGLRALLGDDRGDCAEALALDALDWIPPREKRLVARLWRGATLGEPFEFVHNVCCSDGRTLQVLHRGVLEPGREPGAAPRGVATLQDFTARRVAEQQIETLAHVDPVTGQSNRAHLLHQLGQAVHDSRMKEAGFTLLSVDIARVAELATTIGLAAGDELARVMAQRLLDAGLHDGVLAHLGSGEFAFRLGDGAGQDRGALDLAVQGLRTRLEQPVPMGNIEILPRCRIGAARCPQDAADARALLAAAQAARLDATTKGGASMFQAATSARAMRELQLEAGLRQALQTGALDLAYQPQVSLASGEVVGVEALLRWQSDAWGLVGADELVAVAERANLMPRVGEWVLAEACRQVMRWREAGFASLRVAVNVAPGQLQALDFADTVHRVLQQAGAPSAALALEITERALDQDAGRVIVTLKSLRDSGVEIVLDDFGTGASSVSSLRSLPIDLLKVDRSFVSDVTAAPESASVTRSIINLAHGLQIPVLAEGVETEGQLRMLVANGCDRLQGFLFSPPLTADALGTLLAEGRRLDTHRAAPARRTRTLMLVDDEPNIVASLKRLFRRDGYRLLGANSGAEALEVLAREEVDVILSDQRMPGMTGVDFLRRAKALHPHTVRMTLSGFTDLQSIIDAVNEGAVYKFLTKPWDDERLREHVAQAFAHKEMADENRRLEQAVALAHQEQAGLNERLAQLLDQQRHQSQLMELSASSLHDMVDTLPAAVLAFDPDGHLAYLNRRAIQLLPEANGWLGGEPGPQIRALLDRLHEQAAAPAACRAPLGARTQMAWLAAMPPSGGLERGEVLLLTDAPEGS
jgi:predicted signal transduction protein with EAL and GGDEF domain/FixJ family two-component response regulator